MISQSTSSPSSFATRWSARVFGAGTFSRTRIWAAGLSALVVCGQGFSQGTAPDSDAFAPTAPEIPLAVEVAALEHAHSDPTLAGSIAFYGSSSIRLWKSLAADFPGCRVVNCGFGGSRLSDCLLYAKRLLAPLRPAGIVIYAGENDLANGVEPEQAMSNLQSLLKFVRANYPKIPIAYLSVKPSPGRKKNFASFRRFNHLAEDYLKTQSDAQFINIGAELVDSRDQPRTELFQSDQIHLNRAGYDVLRKAVGRFLANEGLRPVPPAAVVASAKVGS